MPNRERYRRDLARQQNMTLAELEGERERLTRIANERNELAQSIKDEIKANKENKSINSNRRGGGKKRIRKHSGINQRNGRLNKGYKYSGKKLKSGLPQIIKVKSKSRS